MKQIILDTNAIMAIGTWKINLKEALLEAFPFPYKLTLLQGTIDELNKIISEQSGKHREAAKLALQLITHYKFTILPEQGYVDDILVEKSHAGSLVLTQDQELKNRLQKPYLTIRQQKKVILVQ